MAKVRYYYDSETLSYKKIEKSAKDRVRSVLLFLSASALFAVLMLFVLFTFFDSPKEKQLKRELEQMTFQYELLHDRMDQLQVVMEYNRADQLFCLPTKRCSTAIAQVAPTARQYSVITRCR